MGDAPELQPGTSFAGDYRVERRLSEGAQGDVYVVEQLSTRRPRALKVMPREVVASPELRRRFETEARVGARIESDHVVEVIASGVDGESGAPFLVMELLDGDDLWTHVDKGGPRPAEEVQEIFGQLCHALGAAHRAAIVHRDLKPENVVLARPRQRGARFMVKVIDFGVARVLAESKTAQATQSVLGTPLWMAPEQVTPGVPIRPAADVWSLGLMAYHLFTARSYWTTASEPEASVWRILNEVCVTALPRASTRAAEQGRAELLPPGFDAWFARCVDRDPEARFPDAAAAFAALSALLDAAAARPERLEDTSGPAPLVTARAAVEAAMATGPTAPAAPPRASPAAPGRWWPLAALALGVGAALAALLLGGR